MTAAITRASQQPCLPISIPTRSRRVQGHGAASREGAFLDGMSA